MTAAEHEPGRGQAAGLQPASDIRERLRVGDPVAERRDCGVVADRFAADGELAQSYMYTGATENDGSDGALQQIVPVVEAHHVSMFVQHHAEQFGPFRYLEQALRNHDQRRRETQDARRRELRRRRKPIRTPDAVVQMERRFDRHDFAPSAQNGGDVASQ